MSDIEEPPWPGYTDDDDRTAGSSVNSSDSYELSADDDDDTDNLYHPPGEDGDRKWDSVAGRRVLQPQYWTNYRWLPCELGGRLARKLTADTITIVSWNVWFGSRRQADRMRALGSVIRDLDPDFICLQEITPGLLPLIAVQPWARDYVVSDVFADHIDRKTRYGNVVFSKYQFHEFIVHPLPGRMGRKAMLGSVVRRHAAQFVIGTFHLESYPQDEAYRREQLEVFRTLTDHCSHVILVGDTNMIHDSKENAALEPRFRDAWKMLHHRTEDAMARRPGLTFDTESNSMLKEEYAPQVKQTRSDRCFYTPDTIEPLEMRRLGMEPYDPENDRSSYISDHYGLFVRLALR